MPEETTTTSTRLRLTPTQERHAANAVLDALRRPQRRSVEGIQKSFQVIGASSIPNGLPPHVHTRWYVGYAPPHPGLDLPHVGVLISDTTMRDAQPACTVRAWHDLYRVVHQSRSRSLYLTTQHGDGTWNAYATPQTGQAGDAALAILRLALLAGHVHAHPLDKAESTSRT